VPEVSVQGDQPLSHSSPKSAATTSAKSKSKLPLIVGLACVVAGGLLLVLWGRNGVPKGPRLTVGNNPFVYACSVVNADTVAKALGLNDDRSKQAVEEHYAFDPANTTDKQVDLLKSTGLSSISSTCQLKFDRKDVAGADGHKTTEYINVDASIEQYPTEQAAANQFATNQNQAGGEAKALPSYKDSYYSSPTATGSPATLQPVVHYKNLLIAYRAPVPNGDTSGSKTATQLDTLTKDVIARINNGDGARPHNANRAVKIDNNAFADACQSVNFVHVAQAVGGQPAFNPASFIATQDYTPEDNSGVAPKQLLSDCTFGFRTQADAVAQNKHKVSGNDPSTILQAKFPHYILMQIAETASKTDAGKLVSQFKAAAEKQIQTSPNHGIVTDVKLGDQGLKFTQNTPSQDDTFSPDARNDTTMYYIAQDASVYLFSITYVRQTSPYKTTDQTFSDSQMRQLLKTLTEATAYAQH